MRFFTVSDFFWSDRIGLSVPLSASYRLDKSFNPIGQSFRTYKECSTYSKTTYIKSDILKVHKNNVKNT